MKKPACRYGHSKFNHACPGCEQDMVERNPVTNPALIERMLTGPKRNPAADNIGGTIALPVQGDPLHVHFLFDETTPLLMESPVSCHGWVLGGKRFGWLPVRNILAGDCINRRCLTCSAPTGGEKYCRACDPEYIGGEK